ncbi:hypothetical protein ACFYST_05490 [Kitasatospora sp. NPDC004614]|uniref:hypothetical protein n=1 Tax=unclassified Kitasatospora TaxID=2633591 RepID=UPI0036CA2A47
MSGDNRGPGQQPGGQWGQGQPSGQGQWPGYGQPGAPGGGWGQGPWGAVPLAPQPGVIPLRPLSFGEMFSAVFDTVRRYFKALYLPLLALVGIGAVPVTVVALFFVGDLRDAIERLPDDGSAPTWQQLWDLVSPVVLLILVLGLVLFALNVVVAPLATVVLRAATLGRPMTAGQAWKEALPKLWPAVLSQAAVLVPLFLLEVLAFGGPIALTVLNDNPLPVLLLLVLLPAVSIGSVFVTVRLTLQVPVLVLEETTPIGAIRRAWRLNAGNWWRSLLLGFIVAFAGRVAANIVTAPLGIVLGAIMPTSTVGASSQEPVLPSSGVLTTLVVLGALAMLLIAAMTAPLTPLANGVMYIDRRIRTERLDIALAEAAGIRLTDPAAPSAPPAPPAQPGPQSTPQPGSQPAPAAPAAPAEPPARPAPTASEERSEPSSDAPAGQPAPSTKDDSGTS